MNALFSSQGLHTVCNLFTKKFGPTTFRPATGIKTCVQADSGFPVMAEDHTKKHGSLYWRSRPTRTESTSRVGTNTMKDRGSMPLIPLRFILPQESRCPVVTVGLRATIRLS